MNRYKLAVYLRPIAILYVPTMLLAAVIQNFAVAVVAVLALVPLFFLLRCVACGTHIYQDTRMPILALLARPHRFCTKCGRPNDGSDG